MAAQVKKRTNLANGSRCNYAYVRHAMINVIKLAVANEVHRSEGCKLEERTKAHHTKTQRMSERPRPKTLFALMRARPAGIQGANLFKNECSANISHRW